MRPLLSFRARFVSMGVGLVILSAEVARGEGVPVTDASLFSIFALEEQARGGTFPNGESAVAFWMTYCNVGETEIDVRPAMQEEHPFFSMSLYRENDGALEQIALSWLKHAFGADTLSGCLPEPCANPNDATVFGVGCRDTYTAEAQGDRLWLGPREEVDAFLGTWSCEGSFFSGFEPDCVRRYDGTGAGPLENRMIATDADLDVPSATFYYEGQIIVAGDVDRLDNFGSRRFTADFNGSNWVFDEPPGEPFVGGPVVLRWGQTHDVVSVGSTDGDVIVASNVVDEGGGSWRYEYAVMNVDSWREVHAFRMPVTATSVTNIGFHDADEDAGNDWPGTFEDGVVSWAVEDFATNPDAHALGHGELFSFRFTADVAPVDGFALLDLFRPDTGADVVGADLKTPGTIVGVEPDASVPSTLLAAPLVNPVRGGLSVRVRLDAAGPFSAHVYDVTGRHVATLADGLHVAGARVLHWDGTGASGARAPGGVYFLRLRSNARGETHKLVLAR